jgi:pimeloyl-ACP methyl ester carboxylesterase
MYSEPAKLSTNTAQSRVYRRYVDGRFGQLHVRAASPAKATDERPLLCFHLSPLSGVVYETWLGEIGKDRLAFAPDTPGYGMSDPPATQPSISDFAAAMGDLMDVLEISEADVMGYHTGSKICVELAKQRPTQIKHLVLVSAPVYSDEDLASQYAQMGEERPPVDDGSHLIEAWSGHWRWRGPEQSAAALMRIFPDALRGGKRRPWGHRAAFSYQHKDHLPEVTQPVLVINPNDDLTTFTARIEPYLNNGRIVNMEHWGHGFLDHNTAEAGNLIRAFLQE